MANTKRVNISVPPVEWDEFMALCGTKRLAASEAITIYIRQALAGNVPDLAWGELPVQDESELLMRLEQMEQRLTQLEKRDKAQTAKKASL